MCLVIRICESLRSLFWSSIQVMVFWTGGLDYSQANRVLYEPVLLSCPCVFLSSECKYIYIQSNVLVCISVALLLLFVKLSLELNAFWGKMAKYKSNFIEKLRLVEIWEGKLTCYFLHLAL